MGNLLIYSARSQAGGFFFNRVSHRKGQLRRKTMALKMNAQEAADILGITRRRNGDLGEMVRALTLFPWFNTAEDAKRREPT